MKYSEFDIVTQEVPGEVSLSFAITGCEIRCKGCHSPQLWNKNFGNELSEKKYMTLLKRYKKHATCVLFMGGEWYKKELISFLQKAKEMGYKTCLYTGKNEIDHKIYRELNFLKTGSWIREKGGLDKATTNQLFTEVKTLKKLNYLFNKH